MSNRSKAKSLPSQEPLENLTEAPESPLLQTARAQMEEELTQLQATLDRLSDDYADRAEAMVKAWLTDCRSKAKRRINAIELADFFGNGASALPPEHQDVPPEALAPAIEAEVTEC
jgi:hypothetical protein